MSTPNDNKLTKGLGKLSNDEKVMFRLHAEGKLAQPAEQGERKARKINWTGKGGWAALAEDTKRKLTAQPLQKPTQQTYVSASDVEACHKIKTECDALRAALHKVNAQRDDLQARVSGLEGQLAIAEQSKVELLAALKQIKRLGGTSAEASLASAAIARATRK